MILCPLCDQPVPQDHKHRTAKVHMRCLNLLNPMARAMFLAGMARGTPDQAVQDAKDWMAKDPRPSIRRNDLRRGTADALFPGVQGTPQTTQEGPQP